MKQKILFPFALLLLPLAGSAEDAVEIDGIYYNLNSDTKEAEVTNNPNKYSGSVIIPETVTYDNIKYNVTSIGYYAFGYSDILSITIPSSVTSIGEIAFYYCSQITSITIPHSISSIGDRLFSGCNNLTSIKVENGNLVYDSRNNCNAIIKTSSNELIAGCNSTIIPNSVTSIGNYAFYDCRSMTSISIPNSIITIGENAFGYCMGLTSIIIPNSVTSIGYSAFEGCINMKSIDLGNSVESIGRYAFRVCRSLTSIVLPKSLKIIVDGTMFSKCDNLAFIKLENGNTIFDSRDNCNAIIKTETNELIAGCKGTTIPNSLESIGDLSFCDCQGLTSIVIPQNVTKIEPRAFTGCSSLNFISVDSNNSVYDSRDNCNAIIKTATNQLITGSMSTIIPNTVVGIEHDAFDGRTGITKISIPNSVKWISYNAFSDCSGLTSVIIPNSVIGIGSCAFWNCKALTSVTSYIKEPFDIDCFNYHTATLYVPNGAKEKYQTTDGWKEFKNIVEMNPQKIEPVDDGDLDFGGSDSEIDENTDLDGNVIGNIYYNIAPGNGGYDPVEGCIEVTKPTSDEDVEEMDEKDIFGEDASKQFTGIVFKVPAGQGTITINAETVGSIVLKVRIGKQEPFEMILMNKNKIKIPYSVTKPTYVYIYAGEMEADEARGAAKASSSSSSLRIYGLEWALKKKMGDVNGDLVVDVADIASVIDVMAAGSAGDSSASADVNKDGVVDVADIAAIIDQMAAQARISNSED